MNFFPAIAIHAPANEAFRFLPEWRKLQAFGMFQFAAPVCMRGRTDVSSTSNSLHSGLFDRRRNTAYRHYQGGGYGRGAVVQRENSSLPLGCSQHVRSRRARRHAVNRAVFQLQLVSRAGLPPSTA